MWHLSFATKAVAGGAMVTVLLAAGMWLTIRSLDANASAEMANLRAEEQEITLVERLRWNGEMIVSSGRGYLISGDAKLLARLAKSRAEFDRSVVELSTQSLTAESAALVAEVELDARNFVRAQESLVAARAHSTSAAALVSRFEHELLALNAQLSRSLDRLVDHNEAALIDIYRAAETHRDRFTARLYILLTLLICMGTAITSHFGRRLSSAYREEQRAREISRRALAARDELMGVVAHDLRNPLNAISIRATLLSKLSPTDSMRQQADSIVRIAFGMSHLIESMLDATTIEAGRFSVDPAPCDVEDVLRHITEIFGPLCAAKQIRLKRAADQTGLRIWVDEERIIQVLSNLLGNALKFVPQGGEVILSIEREHGMVRFGVADNGVGLNAEHLPHIFDRFWKHGTPQGKGTGLGLFISKGIVDSHHGHIWAHSEAGRGAAFYFTVPLCEPELTDARSATPSDVPASGVVEERAYDGLYANQALNVKPA